MRGYGCATSPVAAFVQRCNTTEAYCMLSAARRMRSARSTSAPLSWAFSCSLNSVGFLFPSIPSSLWYSHEFDLPKYVLERSAYEMASRMSFNCDFIVLSSSFYINRHRCCIDRLARTKRFTRLVPPCHVRKRTNERAHGVCSICSAFTSPYI